MTAYAISRAELGKDAADVGLDGGSATTRRAAISRLDSPRVAVSGDGRRDWFASGAGVVALPLVSQFVAPTLDEGGEPTLQFGV